MDSEEGGCVSGPGLEAGTILQASKTPSTELCWIHDMTIRDVGFADARV